MQQSQPALADLQSDLPHVVIIGGGFAGLRAAKDLARAPVRVTLIDRENHHLFQPLLYQVATAGLSGPDIASPLRKILHKQRNTQVIMSSARSIDTERKVVVADHAEVPYDYLVLACGADHNYFGHAEWQAHAPGLKTLSEAVNIRRRILLAFEAAEREPDPVRRQSMLTFVVIGAGPTGVELSGAISEMARRTMVEDFRQFDPRDTKVILVDMADRVLQDYPEPLSKKACHELQRLGVDVRLGVQVTDVSAREVTINGERVPCRTALWAAGAGASPLAATLGTEQDSSGRVLVNPDLSVPGAPGVFAVGDLAALQRKNGKWVPPVAPAANQQGHHAAVNIKRSLKGQPTLPFRYLDKGYMATIGRSSAVVGVGKLRFSGFIAWLAWLFIHILYLAGFRNRMSVMFDWAWAYLSYQRSARVIARPRQQPVLREGHADDGKPGEDKSPSEKPGDATPGAAKAYRDRAA